MATCDVRGEPKPFYHEPVVPSTVCLSFSGCFQVDFRVRCQVLQDFFFYSRELFRTACFNADRKERACVALTNPGPCAVTEVDTYAIECVHGIDLCKMFRD